MAAALVAASPAIADTDTGTRTFGERHGCDHTHRSSVAYHRIRLLVRHTRPWVDKRRVGHYARCVSTRAKSHRAHELARAYWRWRHAYRQRWVIVFNRLPAADRAWAYRTGACESGNNPATNTGNGFYGSHQFMLATAWAAGFTRRPDLTSWHEQAVRAVWWMWKTSPTQWPICGV